MPKRVNPDIDWKVAVPLLNNPIVLRQTCAVCLISGLVVFIILSSIFMFEGNWSAIIDAALIATAISLGFILMAILVMLVIYGNSMTMEFTLDQRGVLSKVTAKRAKLIARLAFVLGLFSGRFTVAGAGLLAQVGATQLVRWKHVVHIRYDDRRYIIYLTNEWRTVAALFCLESNYLAVKARIEDIHKKTTNTD